MDWEVQHPALLFALVLALLPLLVLPLTPRATPWNALLPVSRGGRWLDLLIRLTGAVAIAALVLGLAGLKRDVVTVVREGYGAHLVLLLDRSTSMDHSFAGHAPTGGEQSKAAAAAEFLRHFVQARSHDRIGVAAFSTGPLFVLPLTDYHPGVLAAIDASRLPGLAYTNVGKGLALALAYFHGEPLASARAVVLVSDGAAAVDHATEAVLRREFATSGARLYWIYLRTAGSPGVFDAPLNPADDNWSIRPERQLHRLFENIGMPYRAYEAERPAALDEALRDIDRLEHAPLQYRELLPRVDLSAWCYGVAFVAVLGLCTVKAMEA